MRRFTIGFVAGMLLFSNAAYAAVQYDMIDLGTLGGSESRAHDINDLGQIVGYSFVSDVPFVLHAFLYENGAMTDLGALRDDRSSAWAINNNSQIAVSTGTNVSAETYLYENGSWTELDTSGSQNHPTGINNSADVVGWTGGSHAFLYDGTFTDLGALYDNWSVALGINDAGQIVGATGTFVSGERGFLYDNGVWTDLGVGSRANGINNSGQIVGENNGHASLYENGAWTDFGSLGGNSRSFAQDINDGGQIVGAFFNTSNNVDGHAFLYDDGTWTDLGTLGGNWSSAAAINNNGQIVGMSETSTGEIHGVLWTPAAIPEPASLIVWSLLGLTTTGAFCWRRRRETQRRQRAFYPIVARRL